jgi:hypothetical protein
VADDTAAGTSRAAQLGQAVAQVTQVLFIARSASPSSSRSSARAVSSRSIVRFAIIGAGAICDVHAQAIRSLPDVAALSLVVSTRAARARRLAEARGAGGYSTDLDAVLADPAIDAVSICTPSGLHATQAVAALEAGKHVMIEKPIDVTLEAADRIVAAERASGAKVTVVSQHRFDRSTEQVVAAIQAGDLGRLTSGIASTAWWRGQSYYDAGRGCCMNCSLLGRRLGACPEPSRKPGGRAAWRRASRVSPRGLGLGTRVTWPRWRRPLR